MKKLIISCLFILPILGFKISFGQGQVPVTGTLTYDFSSGALWLDSSRPIGKVPLFKFFKRAPRNRIFGLYDGQGVAINIMNINPLKYYAETNVSFTTTAVAPPTLTAVSIEDMFKEVEKPKAKPADSVTAPPTRPGAAFDRNTERLMTDEGRPIQRPNAAKMQEIKDLIDCIKQNITAIESKETLAKETGKVFQSFNNLYAEMKKLDNIDSTGFKTRIQEILITPMHNITSTVPNLSVTINSSTDINASNLNILKEHITGNIDIAITEMNSCYEKLFDTLAKYPLEKAALELQYKNDDRNMKTDLMLVQLPATRKEFYKLQDWAKAVREAVNDKLWPEINKSLVAYLFCTDLRFTLTAGTIMANEDLATVTLIIKNVSDNKEVRKIESLKFHTIGGFRMEYGVGLYVTGLGDDEYVTERKTRIEKVAVLNGTTVDSVLQNVNYASLKESSSKNVNWGTMAYFQGRSNWGSWLNIGGYFGIGLLLNNNAKPIFSAGGSLVFGRIPRGNLNIGAVWGKVNRVNPKYELGKEVQGDITDPVVSVTRSSLLIGITWNLGKVGKPATDN